MFGLTGEVFVPSESFRFIRVDGLVISSPVSYPHIYSRLWSILLRHHHWPCTSLPQVSHQLSLSEILSTLSCLVPYIKWLSKILSGKYEICRVAYIQFIFSARHVLRVRVELSQPSYTIGPQPWPFLQNYYLIAGYAVLPFRWVSWSIFGSKCRSP